jgi:hypothetical protein
MTGPKGKLVVWEGRSGALEEGRRGRRGMEPMWRQLSLESVGCGLEMRPVAGAVSGEGRGRRVRDGRT